MSRSKRTLIALLVAAFLALTGCAAVLLYVNGANARAVAGKKPVNVVVAAKRIPAGTKGADIRGSAYIETVVMPKETVPKDALPEIDPSLDQLVLTSDAQPRQILMRGAFGDETPVVGGLKIPEGKVAVSFPIVNTAGVDYVRPGSKVAIFNTFTLAEEKDQIPAGDDLERKHEYNQGTRVVLAKAEVIAIGLPDPAEAQTNSGAKSDKSDKADESSSSSGKTESGSTVLTVAVVQSEAERLIHAAQVGRLYIALLDETSDVRPGPGVNNDSMFK